MVKYKIIEENTEEEVIEASVEAPVSAPVVEDKYPATKTDWKSGDYVTHEYLNNVGNEFLKLNQMFIYTGSYRGTGTQTVELVCPFQPAMLFITGYVPSLVDETVHTSRINYNTFTIGNSASSKTIIFNANDTRIGNSRGTIGTRIDKTYPIYASLIFEPQQDGTWKCGYTAINSSYGAAELSNASGGTYYYTIIGKPSKIYTRYTPEPVEKKIPETSDFYKYYTFSILDGFELTDRIGGNSQEEYLKNVVGGYCLENNIIWQATKVDTVNEIISVKAIDACKLSN